MKHKIYMATINDSTATAVAVSATTDTTVSSANVTTHTQSAASSTTTATTATATGGHNSMATAPPDINKLVISVECFNCHGFKESSDYILSRASDVNFMCLSETWIKSSEPDFIQNIINQHVMSKNNSYVVFSKCGMDEDDEHLPGRPYGGVAIICKVMDNISYEMIKCNTRNIVGVMMKDIHGSPMQMLLGVYMPYYDRSKISQTDAYVEYIDELQCIIDEYGETVPIKIVGDFNARLPNASECDTVNWYKRNGFTSHSKLMHDFIVGNTLNVVDLAFKQHVNYTYFNIARGVFSWIDHVLSTDYDMAWCIQLDRSCVINCL